jgi:hypothetical protein
MRGKTKGSRFIGVLFPFSRASGWKGFCSFHDFNIRLSRLFCQVFGKCDLDDGDGGKQDKKSEQHGFS